MQVEVTDADRDLLIAVCGFDKRGDEAYRIHNGLAFTWEVEQLARHRIAERERVVGEIVAHLKKHKGFGAGWYGAEIEAKFGGDNGQRHED